MTRNQIEYAKHLETSRANKVGEAETYRHNVQQEGIGWAQAGAAQTQAAAATSQAASRAAEVAETTRAHKAQERINWYSAYTQRLGTEASSEAQLTNAATNRQNAIINSSRLAEDIRHNIQTEQDTDIRLTTDAARTTSDILNTWVDNAFGMVNPLYGGTD